MIFIQRNVKDFEKRVARDAIFGTPYRGWTPIGPIN